MRLSKVVSGGQTGVDQAALFAARESGLAIGGWCPPGRQREDGLIAADFPLRETPEERSVDAPEVPRSLRTQWNVRDSDATLILKSAGTPADPGTAFSERWATRCGRPLLICDPADPHAADRIASWLRGAPVSVLNVAGPSERAQPGVGALAYALLLAVFNLRGIRAEPAGPG